MSELWFGIEVDTNAARSKRRRRWVEKVFCHLEVIPLDAAVSKIHARLWADLERRGQSVGAHDLIIAATAIHRRWAVATFNTDDFRRIPELSVVVP